MLIKEIKYTYNDITIVPAVISNINHRSECDPYVKVDNYEDKMFPIFTAPMSNVVDMDNAKIFAENKIIPIIPRNIDIKQRLDIVLNTNKWVSLSLSEFEENIVSRKQNFKDIPHIVIDIANGHMMCLCNAIQLSKEMYGYDKIIIMAGNIANPMSYKNFVNCHCDYIRVGIGGGSGCTTTNNVGIHYPMASLISEIYDYKTKYIEQYNVKETITLPKIVADGSIKSYSDVNKALALGADYVMIGGLFASLYESSADMIMTDDDKLKGSFIEIDKNNISFEEIKSYASQGRKYYKYFYGMASEQGQKDFNVKQLKTTEGTEVLMPVKNNIKGWSNEMRDYLVSALSYTNSKNVTELSPSRVNCVVISNNTKQTIDK